MPVAPGRPVAPNVRLSRQSMALGVFSRTGWRLNDMKRRYSWPLWAVAAIVALLVTLHLALPYLVRDYLNDRLADMGDYRGRIADVDLALWRGAYRINGLQIVKVDGKVPVPFVDAPLIDLSV